MAFKKIQITTKVGNKVTLDRFNMVCRDHFVIYEVPRANLKEAFILGKPIVLGSSHDPEGILNQVWSIDPLIGSIGCKCFSKAAWKKIQKWAKQ